jgi:hypothetical protein
MTSKATRPRRRNPPPTPTDGGTQRRRKLSATRGESERVAVWLTSELATRLRVYAATERMALSVAVEEAVRAYLRTRDG